MEQYQYGVALDRVSAPNASSMASMHVHPSHEIYFLISGRRSYFVGHTIYDVAPGNLVFIPKSVLHRTITPRSNSYDRYVVNFFEPCLTPLIDSVGQDAVSNILNRGCVVLPPQHVRRAMHDFEEMDRALRSSDPLSKAIVHHHLQDLILTALRFGTAKPPYHSESADKIQDVAKFISENYASEISLKRAAEMAYMEETYFSKCFKKLTGCGFQKYLTQTRLQAAERLLLETALSISEISENCGFLSSNYFGDAFRSHYGHSPSDHRKLHG